MATEWKMDYKEETEIFSDKTSEVRGSDSLSLTKQIQIGSGDKSFRVTEQGMWLGSEQFSTAPFSVSMLGAANLGSIDLSGGTIRYRKTSFADSANAGYIFCSQGLYAGGTADATRLKFTIADGSLDLIGTVSGRSTATLAAAIDSSGSLITDIVNAKLDTSAKKILSDFSFGTADYAGALMTGNIVWNTTTGAISSGSGVLVYRKGIVGVSNGSATFSLDASTGSAVFAGTLTAPVGTLGALQIASGGHIRLGQTDYNTGKGFWIGDASGTTKFSVGSASGGEYMIWDGANLDISADLKTFEFFTCGENITAGDVVCIKNSYATSVYPVDTDLWVSEGAPTSNYDNDTELSFYASAAAARRYTYMKFDVSGLVDSQHIQKAELVFDTTYYWGASPQTIRIDRVTSAWSEDGTITWNNQPTVTTDTTELGYVRHSYDNVADPQIIDLTTMVRNWKQGTYSNYGIRIKHNADTSGDFRIRIGSYENATPSARPYLRVIDNSQSDGKIYKADADDYNLVRNVIGIATETKSANEICKVQTSGKYTTSGLSAGDQYYVSSTAGGITSALPSTNLLYHRFVKIGKAVSSTELLIGVDERNCLIEWTLGLDTDSQLDQTQEMASPTTHYYAVPPDTSYLLMVAGEPEFMLHYIPISGILTQKNNTLNFQLSIDYKNNGYRLNVAGLAGLSDMEYAIRAYK